MNIAIIINKEKGMTSRDVVNKLCKLLNTKKIGHTGTLDPMASGVLVCLVGKYTKLVNLITACDKEYIATIKLGIKTDTGDITGKVIETIEIPQIKENNIINVLNSFKGKYEQTIPLYSAKHINGKRLYEYARNNEEVILPKNEVEIKHIELISFNNLEIKFKVLVSKGTYIRSLIESICTKLNTLGTMSELIRTKQGEFTIDKSYKLEDIEKGNYSSLNIKDLLSVKEVNIQDEYYKKIINGNRVVMQQNGYILFKKDNKDIALYYFENNNGILKILF